MGKSKEIRLDFNVDKLTMGLIRAPLEVDLAVDPRPLTKVEQQAISDFIRADKEKRKQKELRKKEAGKRKTKQPD